MSEFLTGYLNSGSFYQQISPTIRVLFPATLPSYYVGVDRTEFLGPPNFDPAEIKGIKGARLD
jgi:hypothetical protein